MGKHSLYTYTGRRKVPDTWNVCYPRTLAWQAGWLHRYAPAFIIIIFAVVIVAVVVFVIEHVAKAHRQQCLYPLYKSDWNNKTQIDRLIKQAEAIDRVTLVNITKLHAIDRVTLSAVYYWHISYTYCLLSFSNTWIIMFIRSLWCTLCIHAASWFSCRPRLSDWKRHGKLFYCVMDLRARNIIPVRGGIFSVVKL